MTREKLQPAVRLPDYEDPEINNLAHAQWALERMTAEERLRAFKWLRAKFQDEWPRG
jgi:hypothetical protein